MVLVQVFFFQTLEFVTLIGVQLIDYDTRIWLVIYLAPQWIMLMLGCGFEFLLRRLWIATFFLGMIQLMWYKFYFKNFFSLD